MTSSIDTSAKEGRGETIGRGRDGKERGADRSGGRRGGSGGGSRSNSMGPRKKKRTNVKCFVAEELKPKKISHLQFGMLSSSEMKRLSQFHVWSNQLFTMPARTPAVGGCLDPRLGVSDKTSVCATCKQSLADCAGHFGHIELALPVFHIGFFKSTVQTLQCICKSCARILLPDGTRRQYLRKMRRPHIDALAREGVLKKVLEVCKKAKSCPHCYASNGTVKRLIGLPTLKIIHQRYSGRQMDSERDELRQQLRTMRRTRPDVPGSSADDPLLHSTVEDLLPTRVMELFRNVPDEDCELLWMDPTSGRPEDLILQTILVPPVPIRPSIGMDGGSNEDDVTIKMQEITEVNLALELALSKGPDTRIISETWNHLQMLVAQFINGETPGITRPQDVKAIKGFCQRIKGKQGRFRGNLSGKRVDFSARTVISPDPNLAVNQVGVPVHVAKIMTFPECVNRTNIEKLRALVRRGPNNHPGANSVRMGGPDGALINLEFADQERTAENLRIGDIVERHMEDDDVVLFNRQPSLHRISIMAHRAKVMKWRTFRFNICVCAPYNADFDGDEMNMHLPQTQEARAEAQNLMGVHANLVSMRDGGPMVAASQDFVGISYLLTQKDQFFDRETFCAMCSYFSDAMEDIDVPIPAILKPVALWTGKQLFSTMLSPKRNCENDSTSVSGPAHVVNFESKEKNYRSDLKLKHFCPNDGWVAFRNSELISGNVAKKSIGTGNKTGLLYVLMRDREPVEAAKMLDRFSKFCSRYFGTHRGFSIGVSDVTPSQILNAMKFELLSDGYQRAKKSIQAYDDGSLELRPGCNAKQSLEEVLNGILGKLREQAGKDAMDRLSWYNSPRIMADAGAKGSTLNISQMMACVGQQNVGGKRIQDGFVHRTLPHFEFHSLTPAAKGFVANSFYTGLAPTEFFFHTMGGREGLVDTAVKTAETGYMARRLMKALEDLSIQYDMSVRNSESTVVQFTYGDDSLNPEFMENSGRPVDMSRIFLHISQVRPCHEEEPLHPDKLMSLVNDALAEERFQKLLPQGKKFLDEVDEFFSGMAEKQRILLQIPSASDDSIDVEDEVDQYPTREAKNIRNQKIWNSCRFTPTQLQLVLERALYKYTRAFIEPGEAIGATGAQSISEPGTQMTLKTFHFAGVASMNVTLGVPRLKEIINASKNISTPIITASLVQKDNKIGARVVKAAIEKTTLGQIAEYIEEVHEPGNSYLSIKLDMEAIEQLKVDIDAWSVRRCILRGPVVKSVASTRKRPEVLGLLGDSHVLVKKGSRYKLRIVVPDGAVSAGKSKKRPKALYFTMQALKKALPEVIVQGIPSVNRAVISQEDGKNGKSTYQLLVEGNGLAEVMGSPGVDGLNTTTNNIIEVEDTLGIEAARTNITKEIFTIMDAYGIGIDHRHLLLLSDVMTFKGQVLGITRFGLSKMRESVLTLASFETPTNHLFDAAVHGRTDAIVGVAECIIMGIPIPIGTGLFKLLKKANYVESDSIEESAPLPHGGFLLAPP